MNPLLRSTTRLATPSRSTSFLLRTPRLIRPYASQSYGGDDMSGHPKSDQPNPKAHLEHPGPESPASKGTTSSSSSSQKDTSSSSSPSQSSSPQSNESSKDSSYPETSNGGSPAINNPGAAPENANEEVRKHNEAVANSHDRPVNQINEDGKVEKGFWQGNAGNK